MDEFGCDHAGNLAERTGRDRDTVTRSVQRDHFGRPVIRAHVHTREIVTRDRLEKPARSSARLRQKRDKCRAVPNDYRISIMRDTESELYRLDLTPYIIPGGGGNTVIMVC